MRCITRGLHSYRYAHSGSSGWQVVIGIETHAQLKSKQKLFSGTFFVATCEQPNAHVTPFDAGFPGTLPRLNQECVDLALRASLALKCAVDPRSSFDRKHYFYSDLPAGYQITQHYKPFARTGSLQLPHLERPPVRIKQIQLEQDTAKSTYDAQRRLTLIDLSRAGSALIEIVTEPDLRSPEEAGSYVRTLQSTLRAIGVSDCNMDMGSFRCDVNVSINRDGDKLGSGTRCEIKNVHSIKFITAAIRHEIGRQRAILEQGGTIEQETRGFDPNTFETYTLRSKENAEDYRYMPDPNLGHLHVSEARLNELSSTQPNLPWEIHERLVKQYGLSEVPANTLMGLEEEHLSRGKGGRGPVAFFRMVCDADQRRNPQIVANWMTQHLLGYLSSRGLTYEDNPIQAAQLGEVIDMVNDGVLTNTSAKHLLRYLLDSPSTAVTELAEAKGLLSRGPVTREELRNLCRRVLDASPQSVADYKKGVKNQKLIKRFLGSVMRESHGRAEVVAVQQMLEKLLR
ncbi:Glutamyl-tRNA amidotransferase B subunit [Fistulina hepatica ATCC 64428]|uniref:Glutamyl-tRNA(Gln) amidotransferase subunit B, mitochondrial n=1 Tax=Fistulina hepatica ATCC 64428 TaxID=1128425 RepID=A0A0D7AL56_9AGAR|nr:Glutamyl-tRNA amidotransferase B subunit [Fistulina hepatica ATCC 64428]